MSKFLTFKTIGGIFGLIVLVIGALFLFVPDTLGYLYGIFPNDVDPPGLSDKELGSRNFGAGSIGMAMLVFACLRTSDFCTMRRCCLALSFGSLVSGSTLLYNMFDSKKIAGCHFFTNIYAWITVAVYFLFVILFIAARANIGKCPE